MMSDSEKQELDSVAWAYLTGAVAEQEELGRVLAGSAGAAVRPMLRAGLRIIREFIITGTKAHETAQAAQLIVEPMLESIHTVCQTAGQPVYDALCRVLTQGDEPLALLATLVLLQEKRPSRRTTILVEDALRFAIENDGKRAYLRSSRATLMSLILAWGGIEHHENIWRELFATQPISEEQVLLIYSNGAIEYLIR